MKIKKIKKIETPSGKNIEYENFPVASWIISKKFRKQIRIFYDFARAADDISDNPKLLSKEKVRRLNFFILSLKNKKKEIVVKAERVKKVCKNNNINLCHCLNLIKAFKQDALKNRYKNWSELMNYCKYSAVPVGRFVLDLHKENKKTYKYSDPLCSALQILNHLQDSKEDYKKLNRVYIPLDLIKKNNANLLQLKKGKTEKNLRNVFDQILNRTNKLILEADKHKKSIKTYSLSFETSFILEIAKKLLKLLKDKDPLKEKVKLNKFDYFFCFIKSLIN